MSIKSFTNIIALKTFSAPSISQSFKYIYVTNCPLQNEQGKFVTFKRIKTLCFF